MHCEIIQVEAVLTAVVGERVALEDLSRFVPEACGEVWSFIRTSGLPAPGRNLAVYQTDGWVEAGVEVSGPFAYGERVRLSKLLSGRVVHAVHLGDYRSLGETHRAVRKWCAEQGHRLTGTCWELYGHWQEAWNTDPEGIRTDVFHLLAGDAGV